MLLPSTEKTTRRPNRTSSSRKTRTQTPWCVFICVYQGGDMQPCLSECFFICVVRHIAVFPVKLRVLPQFIFNSRDPIVMGVSIEAGVLRQGTPLCVPSKGVRRTQKDCVCALGFVNDVSCLFFFVLCFSLWTSAWSPASRWITSLSTAPRKARRSASRSSPFLESRPRCTAAILKPPTSSSARWGHAHRGGRGQALQAQNKTFV